jgi:hypothetical protein
MSEHEHTEPKQDERAEDVEDLEVPEGQQEDVAGGYYKLRSDQEPRADK